MRGFKPDAELWAKVNQAILGENAAVAIVTMIDGMCSLLKAGGIAQDDAGARVHLAAMVLSPDDGTPPGSLMPLLQAEFAKLDDGKWRQ
jgi:hypothetical protein